MDDGRHPGAVADRRPVYRAWFPWRLRGARAVQGPGADGSEANVHPGQVRAHRQHQRPRVNLCSVCVNSASHVTEVPRIFR